MIFRELICSLFKESGSGGSGPDSRVSSSDEREQFIEEGLDRELAREELPGHSARRASRSTRTTESFQLGFQQAIRASNEED